jgi:hypothetical protein
MPSHKFSVLPDAYAVARLGPGDPFPAWALSSRPFASVTRTAEELSIVCLERDTPPHVNAERGWRAIKLLGPLPFDQVGVLASFVSPLAQHGVSIFALSTFDTDYILVKESHVEQTLKALRAAGHTHVA